MKPRNSHRGQRRLAATLAACALLVAGCQGGGSSGSSGSTSSARPAAFTRLTVPAPSLRSNLLGDPAELNAVVHLPRDYGTSGKRYRTVYFLTGWGAPAMAASDVLGDWARRATDDLVIVTVDGNNALGGSFYRNSPVTGDWEDAIAKDLVSYIDGKYRTLPEAASRGIAGHSMGGYGALNLAMNRPDVFGAVGVVAPGVVTDRGLVTTQMFGTESTIRDTLQTLAKLNARSDSEAKAGFVQAVQGAMPDTQFALAYGAAVAPDPSSRTWVRFPYREVGGKLVQDPAIMATWNDGFGNWRTKVERHKAELAKLKGINC